MQSKHNLMTKSHFKKKDYELIAGAIRASKEFKDRGDRNSKEDILRDLTASLCFRFREDNPKFNSDKFIIASGFGE